MVDALEKEVVRLEATNAIGFQLDEEDDDNRPISPLPCQQGCTGSDFQILSPEIFSVQLRMSRSDVNDPAAVASVRISPAHGVDHSSIKVPATIKPPCSPFRQDSPAFPEEVNIVNKNTDIIPPNPSCQAILLSSSPPHKEAIISAVKATRKSIKDLYGKPSWWGCSEECKDIFDPEIGTENPRNDEVLSAQETKLSTYSTHVRRAEAFTVDFGSPAKGANPGARTGNRPTTQVPRRLQRAMYKKEEGEKLTRTQTAHPTALLSQKCTTENKVTGLTSSRGQSLHTQSPMVTSRSSTRNRSVGQTTTKPAFGINSARIGASFRSEKYPPLLFRQSSGLEGAPTRKTIPSSKNAIINSFNKDSSNKEVTKIYSDCKADTCPQAGTNSLRGRASITRNRIPLRRTSYTVKSEAAAKSRQQQEAFPPPHIATRAKAGVGRVGSNATTRRHIDTTQTQTPSVGQKSRPSVTLTDKRPQLTTTKEVSSQLVTGNYGGRQYRGTFAKQQRTPNPVAQKKTVQNNFRAPKYNYHNSSSIISKSSSNRMTSSAPVTPCEAVVSIVAVMEAYKDPKDYLFDRMFSGISLANPKTPDSVSTFSHDMPFLKLTSQHVEDHFSSHHAVNVQAFISDVHHEKPDYASALRRHVPTVEQATSIAPATTFAVPALVPQLSEAPNENVCIATSFLDLEVRHSTDEMDTESAALIQAPSVDSLAPSCAETYILDADETLAAAGIVPVVISCPHKEQTQSTIMETSNTFTLPHDGLTTPQAESLSDSLEGDQLYSTHSKGDSGPSHLKAIRHSTCLAWIVHSQSHSPYDSSVTVPDTSEKCWP